ncbi:transglutaminase domain-containing protein [Muribaculum sp.]|uniref:transglutaminase domain-containing protein n=1 Tax=Muribaculum sp. TaxID=1918611 RepID=UPI0037495A4F
MIKSLLSLASLLIALTINADDIVIKSPGYFTEPIRDGHQLFPDSLVLSTDAEEIEIPSMGMFGRLGNYGKFPNLRKITFGDVDYLPGGLLSDMPNLEEVVFNGMIGHFDCTFISNCPKLKTITFKGPIVTTGGPGFLYNLPNLEKVVFESVVVALGIDLATRHLCPKLNGITCNGAFLKVYNDSLTLAATIDQLKADPRLIADMERIAKWQSEVLRAKNPKWMRKWQYQAAKILQPILTELDSPEADSLKSSMEYAWNLGDDVKNELEVLKASPAYSKLDSVPDIKFQYANPTDSLLTMSRERFNLDSIAGNGDDISRIKNLLYWVHNNISHDGSNGLAPGGRNLRNTYDSALRDSCGYNCRALAICLAEALLAEGIPARYITCLPKAWDTDNDCHVICVAWNESLGKWIWVDPTFAAYVTDENGVMLHPGEVRYRLQHDMPLILNEDANWNNIRTETKEDYLDYYMAKNLYIIEANTLNQAEPEGESSHKQGFHVALVPQGITYPYSNYNITDEEWFWQSPELK